MFDLIVVGGGAAGVFAAIQAKTSSSRVLLLEKSGVLLSKVRVSGGGRCNVTHACFDPLTLVKNYPRGEKELIGPFQRFQPKDIIHWFEERGVRLKTESDGRIFPQSDNSQTIIDCLVTEAEKLGIEILFKQKIENITKEERGFCLHLKDQQLWSKKILLATGSNSEGYRWARSLNHTIQEPIPSLFTFNIPSSPLIRLSGISWDVAVHIEGTYSSQQGALLITHFGFSGPAVLKLSAFEAKFLHEKKYCANIIINWLPDLSKDEIIDQLIKFKATYPQKNFSSENPFFFPKNLWKTLLEIMQKNPMEKIGRVSQKEFHAIAENLHKSIFKMEGKTTHKEEFVTCGGVNLKEINFKTLESKITPGLFFAGEILDIDGITGGFNFQNAWTTGFIAGISSR